MHEMNKSYNNYSYIKGFYIMISFVYLYKAGYSSLNQLKYTKYLNKSLSVFDMIFKQGI